MMQTSIEKFINTDLKEFSNADNVRSLPSVIDGLKDSQRKALFGLIQHGQSEIKVAQLSGYASLITEYEHSEDSMAGTIVGMAQNYPGSNNINLFEPIGQFGNILSSQSAAFRYIYTKPSKWLNKIIRKDDEPILKFREGDDGTLEPLFYFPIVPLWIVNGSVGIGTGHSVKILPRSLKSVIKAIDLIISKKDVSDETKAKLMMPSFNGWKGTVTKLDGDNSYELTGTIERVNTTTLRITEVPVGMDITKLKSVLVDLLEEGQIKDYDNNSTEKSFNVEVKVSRDTTAKTDRKLLEMFKLVSRMTENITLWNTRGHLERYPDPWSALTDSTLYRLEKYEQRRIKHISIHHGQLAFLLNKMKFIKRWNKLKDPGKMKIVDIAVIMTTEEHIPQEDVVRLMQLKISSLTLEQIEELEKECQKERDTIKQLESTTAVAMYELDMKDL